MMIASLLLVIIGFILGKDRRDILGKVLETHFSVLLDRLKDGCCCSRFGQEFILNLLFTVVWLPGKEYFFQEPVITDCVGALSECILGWLLLDNAILLTELLMIILVLLPILVQLVLRWRLALLLLGEKH